MSWSLIVDSGGSESPSNIRVIDLSAGTALAVRNALTSRDIRVVYII